MKNNYKVWLLVLFAGLTSCNKFLDVTPKNVISMKEIESIKKTLAGYLYNVKEGASSNGIPRSPITYMEGGLVDYTEEWDLSLLGNREITEPILQTLDWRIDGTSARWSRYYSIIGFMNLLLEESPKALGDNMTRDIVMGEAYINRAYCYFKLVQLFAPFKDNEKGVPICLETFEDFFKVSLKRNKQTEVYHQIISDLNETAKCLERTQPQTGYNLFYSADILNRLYAQVYHYKAMSGGAAPDDWKNAALFAQKAIGTRVLESNPAALKDLFDVAKPVLSADNESGLRILHFGSGLYSLHGNKQPSVRFYTENYTTDDIRKSLYYKETAQQPALAVSVNKYNYTGFFERSYYLQSAFRLAETFLIRAEALAMSDKLEDAEEVLTLFKLARYTGAIDVPTTKEDILKEIYLERKKEFAFEGDYRWLDMKRLGESAERTVGGKTYKLGKDDWRYTFRIPDSEIKNNKGISQNPGWN